MRRYTLTISFLVALLLIFSNTALAQTPPLSFLAARSYDAGQSPYGVVVADFDGDGKLDMAVPGNNGTGTVTVFLGYGDGNFHPAASSQLGCNNPGMIAVGDFNGDGKPDIAVSGWVGADIVCVQLGNGDGTFQPPMSYSTVARPFGVAIGDFNGDGKADLVLASPDNGSLSVLLGNGDGTFQQAVNYASGVRAYFVAVGDFNGDGKIDLVTTDNDSAGKLNVLLGNGDGTFQSPVRYTVGDNPLGLVVADFNGDGRPDVAVTNYFGNNVSILLGNGDGTFQPAVNYSAGTGPYWVSTGDFDGDGKLDLAVADYAGETVSVLRGNGDGTFSPAVSYGAGSSPSAVATGDFDGDGHPDLAVTNSWDSAVSGFHNNGDGTFLVAPTYKAGQQPFSVAADDFNHDGKVDLVSANRYSNSVSVLMGNGNGTFQGPVNYATGSFPYFVISGDLNQDGISDLAVANNGSNNISVLLGNGDGTFQPATNYAVGSLPYAIAMGDFNHDGNMDLVVANQNDNTVSVLLGAGGGTFLPPVTYAVSYVPTSVAVGDFNRDGVLDLAVANYGGGSISVLLGNGDGTFGASVELPLNTTPIFVIAADLNGDGKLDLATANDQDGTVSVLFGSGDGSFLAPVNYAVGTYAYALTAQDLDGDGFPDLAVANSTSGNISMLLNNGDGTFQSAVNYASGSTPSSIAAADFDGDGRPDLAVANACYNDPRCTGGGNIAILLNRSIGFARAVMTSPPPSSHLPGATVTFIWKAGVGATAYRLDAGSTPGGTQYFQSGNLGNVLTVTANGLPMDGSTVYVTLWSLANGTWLNNKYTYTAYNPADGKAVLTSPPPGSTLPGPAVPFAWTTGTGVTAYMLDAGSTPGGNDYFQSGNLGNSLGVVAYNLPIDGSTVYVTLYSFINGQWYSNAYTYHAYQPAKGVIVSPPPGSQLTDTTVTFEWNPGDGVAFSLDVGSTPGGNEYGHADVGFAFSATISNLPMDGSTVYVTLYSLINGQFYSNAYTYTAFNVNNAKGVLTTPPPGTRFHGSTVTFGWLAGSGATAYQLTAGSTPGGTDYYQSGDLGNVLTTTANGLPTDGSTVYVTLYSKVFGQWLSSAYTYKAYNSNVAPITFLPEVSYDAQASPASVVMADVNGDHKLDLVVGNFYGDPNCQCTGSVSVMLGKGDGTFQAAANYPTGPGTWGVAVGDFNGDGKPDVVAANYGESSVSVLLGNGDGTLRPAISYTTDSNPNSVAVGDLNGDGKLDLVTANVGDNTITVLIGRGDGTFEPPSTYNVGQLPYSVAIGDVNGDGKLDVVVANQLDASISVLLGNGNGTLGAPVNYYGLQAPYAVALGDLNGDGKLDIVASDNTNGSVDVMLGKGDGTFNSPIPYAAVISPTGVAIGDFNDDGSPDLAVADGSGSSEVSVSGGKGDGSFASPLMFNGGQCTYGIAAGDLDGDGKADLAVADYCGNTVNILLTSGGPAQITTPTPGSTFTGSSVTFQWTSSPSATAYSLVVGSTPGGNQYYSSGNLPTTTHSATVTTLPTDGSTVYVTLSSLIGGQWVAKSYTYTAYNSANAKGVLTTPPPGTILTDSTVYFGWTAGQGATSYRLDAGSTPGGTQYFQSPNLGNVLNVLVTTLPVDGSTVYVTLWSLVNGTWLSNQYAYTAFNREAAKGVLTTPPPGSTLPGNTVTFGWNTGVGAMGFRLDVGSAPLGTQYFQSGNLGLVPTVTVNTIPVDGSTVYVTLWTLVNGTWLNNQYTYPASSVLGIITSPSPGAQFPGTTVTFTWDPGSAATAYRLDAGKTPGGRQYFSSQNLGNVLTVTVSGLPSDSSLVYVRLWSLVGGKWLSNSYTYTAWDGALGQAILTSPPPGSQFTGTAVTFGWTQGTGATGYRMNIGSTPGAHDYYSSHVISTQTVTVSNLPSDTSLVYVTLFTQIGGNWYSRTYTYTAWNAAAATAVMFIPVPGTQFSGTAVTFVWGAGTGATAYRLDVGKTPGGHQYYQSGNVNVLTTTVGGLPSNGSTVYVTLYTQINGAWYSNSYTYTAWNFASAQAVMLSPLGGSHFDGTNVTFVWSAGIGATAYRIDVGKAPGAHQYYQSASLSVLTATVSGLPSDASNVYVTLYTQINGAWYAANYVYVAFKPKAITFSPAVNYPAGSFPHAVAVGDFNHDGKLDIAVMDGTDNNVGIMLGNGDGTFKPTVYYNAGKGAWTVVVRDFNGDGKLDLAIANSNGGNVSVLLGNGDGTFRTAVNYSVGSIPWDIIAGDFNGDGKLDLATANQGSSNVSVLLGNGDGTFRTAVAYVVGAIPWSVNVGDFNGDGKLDIVAVSDGPNKAGVLMGKGDGTFQPVVNYAVGTGPSSVGVGDLTGDGKPALVVSNQNSNNVTVLLNKGDGTFAKAVNYNTAGGSRGVVLADFNGDGKLDTAVTNRDNDSLSILAGDGDGTFQAAVTTALGRTAYIAAAGDFNGDGKLDLAIPVVPNSGKGAVLILLNSTP